MAEEATETATEVAPQIKKLGDELVGLTLKQAVDLGSYLKDEYDIEPAAGGGVVMAGPAVAEEPEEQTSFDVILTGHGDKKIQVIKLVREATGLGLKEAKALVDEAPKAIKEGLSKEEADALAEKIKEQGGEVEIK